MQVKDFLVIERRVVYPRIELKGVPTLILPCGRNVNPEEIIEKHGNWIEKKLQFIEDVKKKYKNCKVYNRSDEEFKKLVLKLIEEYSAKIGVRVKKVIFRDMRSKWASCRKNGNVSFNLKLKYLPLSLIRYVVFHELVHLIFHHHKSSFWEYVKKEFKNPERYEEKLFGYWFSIQLID
ncbi:MAG TPA: DUF45 domain-containing protein [bacterium]|nr:DUF45 domain-containing protein [bacterium]HPP30167.1 DUF45 domain-containing protein [bacterium]